MKAVFATAVMFFLLQNCQAQTKGVLNLDSLDFGEANPVSNHKGIEKAPEFPGGIDEFYRFLSKNINYPESAKKNHIQGTVLIRMIVDRDGRVTNVSAVNSVSPDIDQEAIRIVGSSPLWAPGIQSDRPVRVRYAIPVRFDLDNDNSPVYNTVDGEPEFPGGKAGFSDYIKTNIRYPAEITENSGLVTVNFIVEKDGTLSNIRIFIAPTRQMADEALRLIYNSPKWKPGLFKNNPVRVLSSVTIPFEPNN